MCNKGLIVVVVLFCASVITFAQSPSPTPTDKRGLGIESPRQTPGQTTSTTTDVRAREAKPELVLQTGYNNLFGATRMVFSPDGKLLATGTFRSNTVKLWETATNRKLRDLSSSGQTTVTIAPAIAFSRDSRLVAVSGSDNSVTVWDVLSGRELQRLGGSGQGSIMGSLGVFFIGFASDNRLVTVSDAARVWDISTGRELRSLEIGMPGAMAVSGGDGGMTLSPDGTQLLFVTEDNDTEVRVIDLASGREVRRTKIPENQIDSLQLSLTADGRVVAAGVHNKRFKLWDLTSKKDHELGPTSKDYPAVKFSRDGRLLALSDSYTVKLWDVATLRELPALKVPNSGAAPQSDASISFTEDGKRIATGGFDTDIIVWETETGKRLSNLIGRANMAYSVRFSADGNELTSGGRTRWDLRTGRGLRMIPDTGEKTYGVATPDGRLVLVRKANTNVLTLVESPSGKHLFTLTPSGETGIVVRTHFSADTTMVAVVYGAVEDQHPTQTSFTRGAQVKIWDLKTGRELRSITPSEIPMQAEFSADGRSIAVIGGMGQLSLWDVQSGSKLRDLSASTMPNFTPPTTIKPGQMPTMPNMNDLAAMITNTIGTMSAGTMGQTVTSLAFTSDGKLLATGGVESKANIDIAAMMSGATNQRQKKGSKQPDPADLMRDLKVEAVGQVQLWDVASGQPIAAIKGHGRGVSKVAFSRDGKLLASGGTDNTIKIWDV